MALPPYVVQSQIYIIFRDMKVKQMSMIQPVLGHWRSGQSLVGAYTYAVHSLIYDIPRCGGKTHVGDPARARSLKK